MTRPRKNPAVRKNVFIEKATRLFFEKGYTSTSIQDILQAVDDKSVSPSVFYYYFSSKEDIYHTAMENYIEGYLEKLKYCFQDKSLAIEDRFVKVMSVFIETLTESKPGIDTDSAMSNRLFALDLRERIALQVASMWEDSIASLPFHSHSRTKTRSLALYITGGICEMIYNFVFKQGAQQQDAQQQDAQQQDIKTLAHEIIDFSAAVLEIPKRIYKRFITKAENIF